jgi:hypothetical protein
MKVRALEKALEKAADLPAADQDRIGQRLDAYIDDLQALRAMLEEGVHSLDDGHGKRIDIEEIIARARAHDI